VGRKWQIKFNITALTIALKQYPLISEYFLHGHRLAQVTEAKYLGVVLDYKLSFKHYIDSTSQKANQTLAFIPEILP